MLHEVPSGISTVNQKGFITHKCPISIKVCLFIFYYTFIGLLRMNHSISVVWHGSNQLVAVTVCKLSVMFRFSKNPEWKTQEAECLKSKTFIFSACKIESQGAGKN